MLTRKLNIFAISILLILCNTAIAIPERPKATPEAPAADAKAYVLMDFYSNKILASHNPDERFEPASLTKMMTAYVVDQEMKQGKIKMEDEVLISPKAWKAPGSRMFVEVNTKVKVIDLLRGMIIQSGNDASIALAEHIAGSESAFAELMNYYSKALGMNNTHFVNATGLPHEDEYTSAHDMALLAQALIRDFPETYGYYSEKWFVYNNIKQPNRNRLLWRDEKVDGIKTGYTESAGYCLVSSAKNDNTRLISVVLGAESEKKRTNDTHSLLRYGFRFFETHKLYAANTVLNESRVWLGDKNQVKLGVNQDIYVTVPEGQYPQLKASLLVDSEIKAPIAKGKSYGTLTIDLRDENMMSTPLIALENVEAASFVGKIVDSIKLKVHNFFKQESGNG